MENGSSNMCTWITTSSCIGPDITGEKMQDESTELVVIQGVIQDFEVGGGK